MQLASTTPVELTTEET